MRNRVVSADEMGELTVHYTGDANGRSLGSTRPNRHAENRSEYITSLCDQIKVANNRRHTDLTQGCMS